MYGFFPPSFVEGYYSPLPIQATSHFHVLDNQKLTSVINLKLCYILNIILRNKMYNPKKRKKLTSTSNIDVPYMFHSLFLCNSPV